MNPINEAEDKLKTWMMKKKLVNIKDNIKIMKTSWNSTYSVLKNGICIGKGILNTRTERLDNFKFNVFCHSKKRVNPVVHIIKDVNKISKTILPKPKRGQLTVGSGFKGQKISIMG